MFTPGSVPSTHLHPVAPARSEKLPALASAEELRGAAGVAVVAPAQGSATAVPLVDGAAFMAAPEGQRRAKRAHTAAAAVEEGWRSKGTRLGAAATEDERLAQQARASAAAAGEERLALVVYVGQHHAASEVQQARAAPAAAPQERCAAEAGAQGTFCSGAAPGTLLLIVVALSTAERVILCAPAVKRSVDTAQCHACTRFV